jgi:hypothetical protein
MATAKKRWPARTKGPAVGSEAALAQDAEDAGRVPAPACAVRELGDVPLARHCICAALPEWARPCGPCRWRKGEAQ